MRQKFFSFVLIGLLVSCGSVRAQTIGVSSMSEFSTENPPKTISVKLLEPLEVSENEFLQDGVILNGDLIDVVSPKRLKKDADFAFQPKSYVDKNGNTKSVDWKVKASYTVPIDKVKAAKKAALTVGNHLVTGLSMGYAAIEGAVKNEDGNRFKSSVNSVYEASLLSWTEKGEDLYVKPNQVFYLKFPSAKKIAASSEQTQCEGSVQGQNYSFTIEKE